MLILAALIIGICLGALLQESFGLMFLVEQRLKRAETWMARWWARRPWA